MRRCSILLSVLFIFAACNNQSSGSIEAKADTSETKIHYAYTPKEMPNWEMGNPEHVAFVLNAFKKYENGQIDELKEYFADSISVFEDGFEFNGKSDSLISIIKKDVQNRESIVIEMHDWEAVHGKENKEDWVTLWYKAVYRMKDGKVDSAMYVDDIQIVNGKIRVLDTKKRRYPTRK